MKYIFCVFPKPSILLLPRLVFFIALWWSVNLLLVLPNSRVGGEGTADLSAWGHYPAESNDRRSVSQCRGGRDCNLFSVQQFAGLSVMLHFSWSDTYRHTVTTVLVLKVWNILQDNVSFLITQIMLLCWKIDLLAHIDVLLKGFTNNY